MRYLLGSPTRAINQIRPGNAVEVSYHVGIVNTHSAKNIMNHGAEFSPRQRFLIIIRSIPDPSYIFHCCQVSTQTAARRLIDRNGGFPKSSGQPVSRALGSTQQDTALRSAASGTGGK